MVVHFRPNRHYPIYIRTEVTAECKSVEKFIRHEAVDVYSCPVSPDQDVDPDDGAKDRGWKQLWSEHPGGRPGGGGQI